MKKGFTLIELLAVIAVLAIIILIASSYVLNILETSKNNAFKINETTLIKAAINYFSENTNLLPIANSKVEVSINTLKSNNYISNITDPKDGSICSGYVVISNMGENLKYTPYLNCENTTITSSTDDKLLLNYTFDDYEEPTTNLSKDIWEFYTPYHTLVQNGTTLNFTMLSVNTSLVIKRASMGALQNRTFSFSGYLKKNGVPYVAPTSRFSPYNLLASHTNYYSNPTTGYFEGTMLFDSTNSWLLHWGMTNIIGDVITIENFQIEEKPYPTIYTPTDRTGTVYDYVGNNNVTLALATTPYYKTTGVKGGAYEFKTPSRLAIPMNMNNTNYGLPTATYTYSTWINLNKHNASGVGMLLGMAYYSGFGIQFSSDGSSYTRFSTYFRSDTQYGTNNVNLDLNKWYHIVSVLDRPNNQIKFYLNGSLIDTKPINAMPLNYVDRPFGINLMQETGGSGPFIYLDSKIDEVRIYNRVLSDNEIKELYNSSK